MQGLTRATQVLEWKVFHGNGRSREIACTPSPPIVENNTYTLICIQILLSSVAIKHVSLEEFIKISYFKLTVNDMLSK